MFKKLIITTVCASAALVSSAQWTLSSENVGDREFTEKSQGVYELSLGADTIYGRFLLKNGDDVRYGAENTYVCGGVAYNYTTEGDSLMLGSPVVNAVFTLDASAGTLTVDGDIQPLTLRGNAMGAYWNPFEMLPLEYQGSGIYSCSNLQMNARDFTICMLTAPQTMQFDAAASWLVPYRFSATTVSGSKPMQWGVPEKMYIAPRGSVANLYFPEYTARVDITVNLIDVTITATGGFNPPQSTLYLIGGNVAHGDQVVGWTDDGCNKGLAMTRTVNDDNDNVSYTIEGVKIRATSTDDADENNPQGQIEIVSNLGSWQDIESGNCFCWERETRVLTLNSSNTCTTSMRDAGNLIAPIQLPTGTYNLTLVFSPTDQPILTAVQTSTSSLEGVSGDDADSDAPVEWFNLDGRRIATPAGSGVYIRRQGSTSQKVWIFKNK